MRLESTRLVILESSKKNLKWSQNWEKLAQAILGDVCKYIETMLQLELMQLPHKCRIVKVNNKKKTRKQHIDSNGKEIKVSWELFYQQIRSIPWKVSKRAEISFLCWCWDSYRKLHIQKPRSFSWESWHVTWKSLGKHMELLLGWEDKADSWQKKNTVSLKSKNGKTLLIQQMLVWK